VRVIVPIKQMLDPSGITVRRDKERIFVNREEYIIEPGSKAALEAALRLKDVGEVEVVAISMGALQADDALREALAMGCDAAYLLCDGAFEEADISVTARVLAAAVEKLGGAELIVAGRESGDTGAGQIGPRLAEALGFAQVTDVWALEMAGGAIQATRRWGADYATVLALPPTVVTVAPEAFPPRYAHGARIMNAYREWDVPQWTLTDLDLDNADLNPLLVFRGESFPPPLEVGEEFRGDPTVVAREVVAALRLQGFLRSGQSGGKDGL
jgi:electron transfer flavoprotein beta subunit